MGGAKWLEAINSNLQVYPVPTGSVLGIIPLGIFDRKGRGREKMGITGGATSTFSPGANFLIKHRKARMLVKRGENTFRNGDSLQTDANGMARSVELFSAKERLMEGNGGV